MTLPVVPHLAKKYLVAVAICVIITTFIANQRKQLFQFAPRKQNIEPQKKISLKLSPEIQSRIETLALFVGYPRSGHTLIGSLLDAHPHIVIANELDIFQKWTQWTEAEKTRENLLNKMYENSYTQAQGNGFRSASRIELRTYFVPNQWQGKYKDYIKVLGDKKGGKTTKFFSDMPEVTDEVVDKINLPVKLVHMVRNPYDNIATMILRSLNIRTEDAHAAKNKTNNPKAMNDNLRLYLRAVQRNHKLIKRFRSRLLTLHSEDVIANPKEQLKKLCEFFDVTCTEDYLNDCASIIYKSTSKTRRTVVWREADKQKVEKALRFYPFLKRYTFDDE